MTILVFPSALEAAARFADEARAWGVRTLGASSIKDDPNAGCFDAWRPLPFVNDPAFFDSLGRLAQEFAVESIHTPHASTFHLLERALPARLPHLRLRGAGPFKSQMQKVEASLAEASRGLGAVDGFAGRAVNLPPVFLAGLLAQAERLHGECSKAKILALAAAASDAPKGDIVEIGCLYGKSSYVLSRLGAFFGIGGVLAVDPWALAPSIQHDAPLNIQQASGGWDWETVHQGFLINMLACAAPAFNYIRATSWEAHGHYADTSAVHSTEFGAVRFAGRIAMLHLDGNHDEAAVEEDFQLWSRHLVPGGWLVFDDYDWPHGDGPRIAADRAARHYGARLSRRFVGGGAMFMKVEG